MNSKNKGSGSETTRKKGDEQEVNQQLFERTSMHGDVVEREVVLHRDPT